MNILFKPLSIIIVSGFFAFVTITLSEEAFRYSFIESVLGVTVVLIVYYFTLRGVLNAMSKKAKK